eukprot:252316_1
MAVAVLNSLHLLNAWFILTTFQCTALPNFVMVLVDDMGWGDVSYNNGIALTPNIDAFASSPHTIVFQRGYSGAPLCSPTRASVLTGRNGDRECIYSANIKGSQTMPLPTSTFTIAEAVKKANPSYQTAFIGKWHLGDVYNKGKGNPVSSPGDNGFDYWFATERNAATTTPNAGCAIFSDTPDTIVYGHYKNNTVTDVTNIFCSPYFYGNDTNSKGVTSIRYKVDHEYNNDSNNERDSYFIITKFNEWLDTADLRKPFLVMLWLHSPHIPYVMTDAIRDGCRDGTYCKPSPNGTAYTSRELDYYGTIVDIDQQIGRVRQLLKDYNIYEDTWLWFSSDNGPQQGHPGRTGGLRGYKDDVWEGGIRVPTIMEWPGVIPNDSFVSHFPVVTYDLLPSILDVLKVESDTPDWDLDGVSLMNTLRGGGVGSMTRSRPIGFTYMGGGLSLAWMDGDWKIVQNSNHCKGDECDAALYNLRNDPFETTDLSSQHTEGYRFRRMKDEMNDWYRSVMKSQYRDTGCIVDRAKSYQKYVTIAVIVASVALCCCILCGCVACIACIYVYVCVNDDGDDEEIEMTENTEEDERKTDDENRDAGDDGKGVYQRVPLQMQHESIHVRSKQQLKMFCASF